MTARGLAVLLAAAGIAVPAGAAWAQMGHGDGPSIPVSIGFASYEPQHLDVVVGETVMWTNDSVRKHTVTSDAGLFESGEVLPADHYARRMDVEGAFPYHCRLHPGIAGEVDAHVLLLEPPAAPAGPGRPFPLSGRSALPPRSDVTIEEDTGGGFRPVTSTQTRDDGGFTASVVPRTSARYRAVSGGGSESPPVQLLVLDRTVSAVAARHGRFGIVRASVTPSAPGQTVVLQLRLRERFGWWPVRSTRLDRGSRVRFRAPLRPGAATRVVLTLRDRATPLAVSPVVRIPPPRGPGAS
jgi:plastocyanin